MAGDNGGGEDRRMNDKLSDRLRAAMSDHSAAFPNGNWREANERLGALWKETLLIIIRSGHEPYVSNEKRLAVIEGLGL